MSMCEKIAEFASTLLLRIIICSKIGWQMVPYKGTLMTDRQTDSIDITLLLFQKLLGL